jgi:hypothetical protein
VTDEAADCPKCGSEWVTEEYHHTPKKCPQRIKGRHDCYVCLICRHAWSERVRDRAALHRTEPMRTCGTRYATADAALRSKRGQRADVQAVPCSCEGWHLHRAPAGRIPAKAAPNRRKPPGRRKPLRPVSKKRAKENRVRAAVIAELYPERPRCACGCGRLADDVHEILSRARGGSITDPGNLAPVARVCHDAITDEAPFGYELGLSVHSWDALAVRGAA